MFVAAIIAIFVVHARLFRPTWDYFPPDSLVNSLERNCIVTAEVRDVAFFSYIVVALGMMTLFYSILCAQSAAEGGTAGCTESTA